MGQTATPRKLEERLEQRESLKRFNVELPESMHSALKAKAASQGITMKELAYELFQLYLDDRLQEVRKDDNDH